MGKERIAAAFAAARARGEVALIPYVPAGYPTLATSAEVALALARAGADLIEIGIPFSDPLADGATIQRATQVALKGGITFDGCLELARGLRAQVDTPIIFMGYYNPLHHRGPARAVAEAAAAGVDGLIVPDLPPEEAGELRAATEAHDLALIFLVSPVSSEERLAAVAAHGSGFLYCVSLTGVTGARAELAATLPAYLARVRAHTGLPLAVGFGLSTAEHVAQVGALADGAVVASALIDRLAEAPGQEAETAAAYLRSLRPAPAGVAS
jgi:tryptophan synthase alpha chain